MIPVNASQPLTFGGPNEMHLREFGEIYSNGYYKAVRDALSLLVHLHNQTDSDQPGRREALRNAALTLAAAHEFDMNFLSVQFYVPPASRA